MEAHRIWHDPVIEIFGNVITPGVRCSGQAYDLVNRQWYQLNVDAPINDDDWMSDVLAKHIREYYQAHKARPPWNTMHTTLAGTSAIFETKPYNLVARPIREKLSYGTGPADMLSTTMFSQVREKSYLSRAADRCVWNGRDCVFKRIEFDCDIQRSEREIRNRETLIGFMKGVASAKDREEEMERRFKVVPILAVVIDDKELGNVVGLLLPFAGDTLEDVAASESDSSIPVTEAQLWDLARGVRELSRCGIMHGDIANRNTTLQKRLGSRSQNETATLMLIDMGDEAPEYDNDMKALGDLVLWCLEHASHLKRNTGAKIRILLVAIIFKTDGNFDRALEVLSAGKVSCA